MPVLYIIVAVVIVARLLKSVSFVSKFSSSNYSKESGIGVLKFLFNKGYYGEGLTFFELEKIACYSKILANVYLPTEDGTTEIDLVYIAPSGIYVIESKNYSGWIFGDANSRNWTSVIHKSKYKFYNPIWQNKKHVKYLKAVLGDVVTKSIIVFSERCELKKVNAMNNVVIKRNKVRETIVNELENVVYTEADINNFYHVLKQFSNQSVAVKQQHIKNINEHKGTR